MKIFGYNLPGTQVIKVSVGAKDVTITMIALFAIGSAGIGGVFLGVGVFGNTVAFSLIGAGSGLLILDVVGGIVIKLCRPYSRNKHLSNFSNDEYIFFPQFAHAASSSTVKLNLSSKEETFALFEENVMKLKQLAKDNENLLENEEWEGACTTLHFIITQLERSDRKKYKDLINEILKLQISMKESGKKDAQLKDLKKQLLIYFFLETLNSQIMFVKAMQKRLKDNESEFNQEEFDFIDQTLKLYMKRLKNGRIVAIAVWYHCTDAVETIKKILDSGIHVTDGPFHGAFVSNEPEVSGYGPVGVAVSNRIQKTAVEGGGKERCLPTTSCAQGKKAVYYGVPPYNTYYQGNGIKNKQAGVLYWLGFQYEIPIKRLDKLDDPLKHYKDNTVSSIFYVEDRISKKDQACLKKYAAKRKIPCISFDQLCAFRKISNAVTPLSMPVEWKHLKESRIIKN